MEKSQKNKILGIDYGDHYIGLAIFDSSVNFTYPLKTIKREKENVLRPSIREIADIVKNENITELVLGLPVNMDGTSGERAWKVTNFQKMLKNKLPDMKITLQDERLSTEEAKEILMSRGIKKEDMKMYLDQVAAEIIIKSFLAKRN